MTDPLAAAVSAQASDVNLRQGSVTAIDLTTGAVTVTVQGGNVSKNVGWLQSYTPVIGDDVLIAVNGQSWTILGATGAAPGPAARGEIGTYFAIPTTVAASSGTEVAIPSASYTQEPVLALPNGHVFRVAVNFGAYPSVGTASLTTVRVRVGAQTITGTQLLFLNPNLGPFGGLVAGYSYVGFFKNTSGVLVSTKLSITNQRTTGSATTNLYGDANIPIQMVVEDFGTTFRHAGLAAN